MSNEVSKSWFCVLNNPTNHGYSGTPAEIVDRILNEWVNDEHPTRTAAATYCISKDGLPHIHAIFEDTKAMRFSKIKKVFPTMHIEATKGNKEQAENYIKKRGSFEEKGEQIIYSNNIGEIKGTQGARRDLGIIDDLIEQGKTPNQIMDMSITFRRYEGLIKATYFAKRLKETSVKRNVRVVWHCGESGSGKTYEYVQMCEKYGRDDVYLLNDYDKGGFDNYYGQKILCMDEFRGQMRFALLMNYLDGYLTQIPCRYSNGYSLWSEVHIFTVLPPEKVYENMVTEHQHLDTFTQLKRRIDTVVYHWKDATGYYAYPLPMSKYISYEDLKNRALGLYDFKNATDEEQLVFDL